MHEAWPSWAPMETRAPVDGEIGATQWDTNDIRTCSLHEHNRSGGLNIEQ